MLVSRTASSLNLRVRLVDNDDDPLPNIAYNNADLTVRYRRPTDTSWQTITLVAGTPGSWTANGWIGIGGGWHELGLPDAAIVPGGRTELEIVYAANRPQADAIDAVLGLADDEAETIAESVAEQVLDAFAASQLLLTDLGRFVTASEINLRQGDDYLASKGTAWEKTITLAGYDFTTVGLTVRFGAGNIAGQPIITGTASLHDKAVGSVKLRLEFDRNDTKAIAQGSYHWDAEVVDSDGDVLTIDGGMLHLQASWTTLT